MGIIFLKVKHNVGSSHTEPFHLNDSEMHPGESVFPLQHPPFLLHSVKLLLQLCPLPTVTAKHKALPGSPEWTEPSSRRSEPVCGGSGPRHPGPERRAGRSLREVQWWLRWVPRCWHWDGRPGAGEGEGVAEWSWPLPLASGGLSAPEAKQQIGAGKLWTAHGFTSSLLLRELRELTGMAFPKTLLAYVWDEDDR